MKLDNNETITHNFSLTNSLTQTPPLSLTHTRSFSLIHTIILSLTWLDSTHAEFLGVERGDVEKAFKVDWRICSKVKSEHGSVVGVGDVFVELVVLRCSQFSVM